MADIKIQRRRPHTWTTILVILIVVLVIMYFIIRHNASPQALLTIPQQIPALIFQYLF